MALFKSMGQMANTAGTMFPGTIVPIRLEPSKCVRYQYASFARLLRRSGDMMSLNNKKLALCLGLVAGVSATFVTGSLASLTGFGEAEFNARRVYSVAASAAAAGQTLEQQYDHFLATCRAEIREKCDMVRSGQVSGIWAFGACPSDADAYSNCLRAWAALPPSDSFLAHANALVMAAPVLLPVVRDFAMFFVLTAAAVLLWRPFVRWLRE
jgi:hypothetical protein